LLAMSILTQFERSVPVTALKPQGKEEGRSAGARTNRHHTAQSTRVGEDPVSRRCIALDLTVLAATRPRLARPSARSSQVTGRGATDPRREAPNAKGSAELNPC